MVIFLVSVSFLSERINSFVLMVTIYFIMALVSKGLKVSLPIPDIIK